jgi:hypothetical protein
MNDGNIRQVLAGQKPFVVGITSDQSIAYGALDHVRTEGPAGRLAELLGRRLRQDDGHLLPFVRSHGHTGGANIVI